jgi:hypothetical protein
VGGAIPCLEGSNPSLSALTLLLLLACLVMIYMIGVSATAIVWLIIDIRTDRERDPVPALWWPLVHWHWLTKS